MIFTATNIEGAFVIEPEPHLDDRGFFARTYCAREFGERGLSTTFVQCSVSVNRRRGTLRGLHFQYFPACEAKLVRCTTGAIHDVIVDLRKDSPTYLQHVAVELNARNRRALYVPEMIAHGFQTLEDHSEVFYHISQFFTPDRSTGLRFDDPKLGIQWPLPVTAMSDRDRSWSLLS